MKLLRNLLYTLGILAATSLMFSCEEESFVYDGDSFIHWGSATVSVNENSTATVAIPVFLAAPAQSGAVTATFSITGDAPAADFSIVGGVNEVTFPAGVFSDTVRLTVVDNIVTDGDRSFTLSLTGVSGGNFVLGYPGPDQLFREVAVTIIDDDCPFDQAGYSGTLNVTRTAFNSDGTTTEANFQATATAGASIFELTVTNFSTFQDGEEVTFTAITCPEYLAWDQTATVYVHPMFGATTLERQDFNGRLADAGVTLDPTNDADWSIFDNDNLTFTVYGRLYVPALSGAFGVYRFDYSK